MEARLVGTPNGWTYELKHNGRWQVIHTDADCRTVKTWLAPVEAQNAAARQCKPVIITWRQWTRKAYA
jgi:hypothetical protein